MNFLKKCRASQGQVIALMTIAHFTYYLDLNIVSPLGPKIFDQFGISESTFGLIIAAYSYMAFLCGLFVVRWIDRFNYRKVFLFLYAGFIFGSILCAIPSSSVSMFLVARGITGAFGGVLVSNLMAIISHRVPEASRGKALGYYMIAPPMAFVIGIPTCLWAANHIGWNWAFITTTSVSVLCWILAFIALPQMKPHNIKAKTVPQSGAIKYALSNRNTLASIASVITQTLGFYIMVPFLSTNLVHNVGIKETNLPLIYIATGIIAGAMSIIAGRLSDQWGLKKAYILWLAASLPPIYILSHTGPMSLLAVIILFCALNAFNLCRRTVGIAATMQVLSPQFRASFLSINTSVENLMIAGASTAGGMILRSDAGGHFLNFWVLGALSIGFFLFSAIPIMALRLKRAVV